ncbi:hypothetical protein G7Y89_g12621 [Cudoniella acicularis]|uniref:Uncharacterized protein n=1 Tax=Cudoniella acicularis TaxID=354080 RepID=A0A8H4VZH1_9HELO|nr:hypothetical protein G7Y89_g12621 [Cudoniella acicularis]
MVTVAVLVGGRVGHEVGFVEGQVVGIMVTAERQDVGPVEDPWLGDDDGQLDGKTVTINPPEEQDAVMIDAGSVVGVIDGQVVGIMLDGKTVTIDPPEVQEPVMVDPGSMVVTTTGGVGVIDGQVVGIIVTAVGHDVGTIRDVWLNGDDGQLDGKTVTTEPPEDTVMTDAGSVVVITTGVIGVVDGQLVGKTVTAEGQDVGTVTTVFDDNVGQLDGKTVMTDPPGEQDPVRVATESVVVTTTGMHGVVRCCCSDDDVTDVTGGHNEVGGEGVYGTVTTLDGVEDVVYGVVEELGRLGDEDSMFLVEDVVHSVAEELGGIAGDHVHGVVGELEGLDEGDGMLIVEDVGYGVVEKLRRLGDDDGKLFVEDVAHGVIEELGGINEDHGVLFEAVVLDISDSSQGVALLG